MKKYFSSNSFKMVVSQSKLQLNINTNLEIFTGGKS